MTTTAKITESVSVWYAEVDGEIVEQAGTHAVVLDADGEEVDDFSGPVSEEWQPQGWDAALAEAGYRRVGDWDLSDYSAPVVPAVDVDQA